MGMVMETIILPEMEGGLRVFKCGVINCGKTFTAQAEMALRSHMEHRHGAYYIKVGKGKYILRFCRICGEDRSFSSEADLDNHIEESHPKEHFGERLDFDSEPENMPRIKPDPDGEDITANLLHNLNIPKVIEHSSNTNHEFPRSKISESPSTVVQRQPSVEDGEIESPQKSPARSRSPPTPILEDLKRKKKSRKSRSTSSESNSSID